MLLRRFCFSKFQESVFILFLNENKHSTLVFDTDNANKKVQQPTELNPTLYACLTQRFCIIKYNTDWCLVKSKLKHTQQVDATVVVDCRYCHQSQTVLKVFHKIHKALQVLCWQICFYPYNLTILLYLELMCNIIDTIVSLFSSLSDIAFFTNLRHTFFCFSIVETFHFNILK